MPAMPAMFCARRYSSSDCRARQLLAIGESWLITKPATYERSHSRSSGFTPTLPISGAVIVTI